MSVIMGEGSIQKEPLHLSNDRMFRIIFILDSEVLEHLFQRIFEFWKDLPHFESTISCHYAFKITFYFL